jgi:hypothetical protein
LSFSTPPVDIPFLGLVFLTYDPAGMLCEYRAKSIFINFIEKQRVDGMV